MWLEFQLSVLRNSEGDKRKEVGKGVRRLARSLLKEDRNSSEVLCKLVQVELELNWMDGGYMILSAKLETVLTSLSVVGEEGGDTRLARAAAELGINKTTSLR